MKTGAQMLKHKVNVHCENNEALCGDYKSLIEKAINKALESENADTLCVVNVLITNDETIRAYNRDYRGIDSATDVLSFPMQELSDAGWSALRKPEYDEDTGDLPLGDIVISTETVIPQAKQYGNTNEYETAYLIIHSTLHLIGYDHDFDDNEKIMHNKAKMILKKLGYILK